VHSARFGKRSQRDRADLGGRGKIAARLRATINEVLLR
jgi:hypothetical protein